MIKEALAREEELKYQIHLLKIARDVATKDVGTRPHKKKAKASISNENDNQNGPSKIPNLEKHKTPQLGDLIR